MNRNSLWRRAAVLAAVAVVGGRLGYAADAKKVSPRPSERAAAQFRALSAELEGYEQAVHKLSTVGGPLDVKRADIPNLSKACQALSVQNPGVCELASRTTPAVGRESLNCRDIYWRLVQSKLAITASDQPDAARRTCKTMTAQTDTFKNVPFTPDAWCDFYVGYVSGKYNMTELMRTRATPAQREKFAPLIPAWEQRERIIAGAGEPNACRSARSGFERVICEEARLYREAYKSKDPSMCGHSGVCRALLGQGASSCSQYDLGSDDGKDQILKLTAKISELSRRIQTAEPQHAGHGLEELRAGHQQWAGLQVRCQAALTTLAGGAGKSDNPARRKPALKE